MSYTQLTREQNYQIYALMKALCAQLKAMLSVIREFDRQIAEVCAGHENYELFKSLPGAGEVYASRLTAALGSARRRWQSAGWVSSSWFS